MNAKFRSVPVQSLAVPKESEVFHTLSLNRPNMGGSVLGLNAHSVSNGIVSIAVTILKYSACHLEQLGTPDINMAVARQALTNAVVVYNLLQDMYI